MNIKFEQFCFLAACRQDANRKRRRLLASYHKIAEKSKCKNYLVERHDLKESLALYREHADAMTHTTKTHYSPLRRELNVGTYYNTSNNLCSILYKGKEYFIDRIEEIATNYEFECMVLGDGNPPINPYLGE